MTDKEKKVKETMEFLGLLGVTLNKKNTKTLKDWLLKDLEIAYKSGMLDGAKKVRDIIW